MSVSNDGQVPYYNPMSKAPALTYSIEAEMLLRLCSPDFDQNQRETVRSIVIERSPNWKVFLHLAGHHGMLPLACSKLLESCRGDIDPENVEIITRSTMATFRRHLPSLAILKDLLESFRRHGLQAIPIKGPALGEFLYGEPFMRQFGDLDILISPNHMPQARQIVKDRGFEPPFFEPRPAQSGQGPVSSRHEHYMIPGSDAHLELHWEIAHKGFAESFNAEFFWRNLGQRRYDGVHILWPSKEILLLYAAIHGTRHGWTRLMWICDVAWLATRLSPQELFTAVELAGSLSCQRLLVGALLVAHSMLGGISQAMASYSRNSDIRHKALCALVQRELFIEKGHDREKVNFFLCRLLSMDGPWDTALVPFHYLASPPSAFPILGLGPLRAFPHFIVRVLRTMGSYIAK